jgi:hypothetical protein
MLREKAIKEIWHLFSAHPQEARIRKKITLLMSMVLAPILTQPCELTRPQWLPAFIPSVWRIEALPY